MSINFAPMGARLRRHMSTTLCDIVPEASLAWLSARAEEHSKVLNIGATERRSSEVPGRRMPELTDGRNG